MFSSVGTLSIIAQLYKPDNPISIAAAKSTSRELNFFRPPKVRAICQISCFSESRIRTNVLFMIGQLQEHLFQRLVARDFLHRTQRRQTSIF